MQPFFRFTGPPLAASPLREGRRDDSIPSGSVCSVGYRIEPDFIAWGFRVFGVFRGFTGLDFPGWACRLDFCAERAVPSGARRIGGVSGSSWLEWFTRRRGERGGLAGLVPASSAPPRETLLSFQGTATRWRLQVGEGGSGDSIASGSVCVPWATGFGRDRPTRRVIPDGAHSRLRHGGAVPGVIPAPSGRHGFRRWR